MTKVEKIKCEKLMLEAIENAKQAQEKHKESEKYRFPNNYDEIKSDIEKRKSDQHYGYAEGINQVLTILEFKHDRMKELSELLKLCTYDGWEESKGRILYCNERKLKRKRWK